MVSVLTRHCSFRELEITSVNNECQCRIYFSHVQLFEEQSEDLGLM